MSYLGTTLLLIVCTIAYCLVLLGMRIDSTAKFDRFSKWLQTQLASKPPMPFLSRLRWAELIVPILGVVVWFLTKSLAMAGVLMLAALCFTIIVALHIILAAYKKIRHE